ncbi:MAG TPA: ATP-binding protein [Anaerolineaceae bacterium]|nr:ATP-binding protein [Anaerolineaceae bacterium]
MKELSLHLLDIAENSINAESSHITIIVEENSSNDRLILTVKDNGKGMSAEMAERIVDPFITSRTTRKVGLGIPLLKAAAEMCNGFLTVDSTPGVGTKIIVQFQRSHIDRMPLGDLAGTILHLVVGSPHIHWTFIYKVNEDIYEFDDQFIKQELDGIPLSEPVILSFIRNELTSGINNLSLTYEY